MCVSRSTDCNLMVPQLRNYICQAGRVFVRAVSGGGVGV